MWVSKPSLLLFQKKRRLTQLKKEKLQASNKTVDTPRSNKTDKFKSIDNSMSNQITDTENTVDKSRSIPITNLSSKSTRI